MMPQRIRRLLGITLASVLFASSLSAGEPRELIRDGRFEQGFWILAPKHPLQGGKVTREGTLQRTADHGEPVWELVQWYSRESIAGIPPSPSDAGGLIWSSDLKSVLLNPPGTPEGELGLQVHSINEFHGRLRRNEDPWPHLLIQQNFHGAGGPALSDLPAVSQIDRAQFHVDLLLEMAEHQAPASQFVMYFLVANVNPHSPGRGDMMWFGMLFYDDRTPLPTPYMIGGDRDHGKFIYNTGLSPFLEEGLAVGEWKSIDADLAPSLRDAFQQAWDRGLLTQSRDLGDYKITGMNIGWEVPGLAHVAMRVRNLSFAVTLQK